MRKLKLSELNRLNPEEFREAEKTPVVLVVDSVRSAHNVGSFFRTADAFRLEKIYLCGFSAKPPHVEIYKTALGAEDTVDWEYAGDIVTLVQQLQQEKYFIISLEQTDESVPLQQLKIEPGTRYALVVGNEVEGVNEAVISLSNLVAEIPQQGTKHSLNVSVAAGIALWKMTEQMIKA